MMHRASDRGFTLIELLVVIAIIGILSAVVLVSLNVARTKARDSRRLADMQQIVRALELYYAENKQYPSRDSAQTDSTNCGPSNSWCDLENDLEPFIAELPRDPTRSDTWRYYYDSDTGDGNQTFGMMIRFEDSSNFPKVDADGGFYQGPIINPAEGDCCFYELGDQPTYCMKAAGDHSAGSNWFTSGNNVCSTGTN